ncbi:serine hydrolase domain-containing protein [Flavobacterium sp. JAS]|uniref:serine hydrolase domain-containing protein n=1 Tax=Flavobacterium sp. JAS TaxID=2897329 RepID=UPI001E3D9032|nr:serine hydrolase domain-containing protein [Flavobacterium sp. JAS]MCD0471919.1 beta-lactamase family protein [Flavobacterium sp. JAS]
MLKLFISLAAILSFTVVTGQEKAKTTQNPNTQIDQYLAEVVGKYNMPGIAVAVIKNDKIIHRNNYGKANIEFDVPVSNKSIFRIYSLTKTMIVTGIFQLIEQNKLALEDPISKYLPDLPSTWNSVQVKHLVTHSSGLPDIVNYEQLPENEAKEKVFADAIQFEKGSKYEYNQTNFWLLQKIIETISKQDIEMFIIGNQFGNQTANTNVFFSTDSRDIILNRVTPYNNFSGGNMQIGLSNNKSYLNSCNGINITMDEFIQWDSKFNQNKLINEKTKKTMWELFPYSKTDYKFTYGWDERVINEHKSYGFSGGRRAAYRNFPKDNLSIIFLANGIGSDVNVEDIVNHIAYLVDNDIIDYGFVAYETLMKSAQENVSGFKNTFATLRKDPKYSNVNFEEHLNRIGYMLLYVDKKVPEAVSVFSLNAKEFPKSSNVYDSLGEAYEVNKDIKNAIVSYTKAVELNTDPGYQTRISKKIKELKELSK